jgi:hypothetical protein
MSAIITRYFDLAQLALASYTDFTSLFGTPQNPQIPSASGVRNAVLGDFPFPLANQFAGVANPGQGFRVLSQRTIANGFSATLFERIDGLNEKVLVIRGTEPTQLADILTDVNLALFGNQNFSNQYKSLREYIRELRTPVGQNTVDQKPGLGLLSNTDPISVTGHSLGGWLGAALSTDLEFRDQIQQVYTYNAPGFNGGFGPLLELLGVNGPVVDNGKVVNFIAQGPTLIAGVGEVIGPRVDVFIENDGALHDHSINTLTDALAVYDLFARISSSAELSSITNFLKAASNVDTDSLEQSVTGLHELFLNQPATFATEEPARRIDLYERLFAVRTLEQVNGTYQLVDLTSPGFSAPVIAGNADVETTDAVAYRYALTALNAFAVLGATTTQTEALYALHRSGGALDLFNDTDGTGMLTTQYLTDRALFLTEKLALNQLDQDTSTRNIHFVDVASNYEIKTNSSIFTTDRQFLFGSDDIDPLTGGSKDDHLYGGDGDDVLTGLGGDDYLQGDAGNDTYIYNTGDGFDTILDTGGDGSIVVDGVILAGGAQYGDRRVHRDDNGHLYVQVADKTLLIDGRMLVNNYTPSETTGALGLNMARALADVNPHTVFPDLVGDLAPLDGDPTHQQPDGAVHAWTDALGNLLVGAPSPNRADTLYDRAGNDHIISGGGDDHLYATRGGDDVLDAGAGDDELQLERMAA